MDVEYIQNMAGVHRYANSGNSGGSIMGMTVIKLYVSENQYLVYITWNFAGHTGYKTPNHLIILLSKIMAIHPKVLLHPRIMTMIVSVMKNDSNSKIHKKLIDDHFTKNNKLSQNT